MKFIRKNNKKTDEEQDKVLRIAVTVVIALLIIGTFIVVLRLMNPRADITAGQKLLKQMDKGNLTAIDEKIQTLEKADKEADEAWQNRTQNEKFKNSMILGDSIAQGAYEFEILDAAFVSATKGAELSMPEESGSAADLAKAVAAKPQNIFLTYGMNDLESEKGNAQVFAEDYKKFIDSIRTQLPDTKIYVNSVLPIQEAAVSSNAKYKNVPAFNEQLQKLCEAEGIAYIDQTDNVKEEYYEPDGIHMTPDFYPGWLNRMAEAAEL